MQAFVFFLVIMCGPHFCGAPVRPNMPKSASCMSAMFWVNFLPPEGEQWFSSELNRGYFHRRRLHGAMGTIAPRLLIHDNFLQQ